jgi:hypothetical protein
MDLVGEPSRAQSKTPPAHDKRRRILWSIAWLSLLVIIGTVLPSADLRWLKGLLGGSGEEHAQTSSKSSRVPPSHLNMVDPALQQAAFLPVRLVAPPDPELAGQFMRLWRVSGPSLCKAFRDAGIETSEWRAASMRSETYECYFQRVYEKDAVRPLRSVFLKIRGSQSGEILDIRAKIVGATTGDQGYLDPALLRIFETVVQQVRWNDFHDTLSPIRSLQDVEYQRFGADFSFTRETDSDNNFIFELFLTASPGPQTRTKAYFSINRWVPLPQQQASLASSPPIWHVGK